MFEEQKQAKAEANVHEAFEAVWSLIREAEYNASRPYTATEMNVLRSIRRRLDNDYQRLLSVRFAAEKRARKKAQREARRVS